MRVTKRTCPTLPVRALAFASGRIVALALALTFGIAASAQTLTKSFSPTTILSGGTTVLTFTVTMPAGTGAVSNVGFVDTLPSSLRVASVSSVGGTCANAAAATTASPGSGTVTVTNLQVPAGPSSCTVTVNVTNAAGQINSSCVSNPAAFTNASANVTATNVANGVTPSCLAVNSPSPTLTKSFSPTAIADGGTAVLTFALTKPAGAPAQSNVGFVDTLPSSLRVASVASVGGTCANAAAATTASPGSGTVTVTNLQVPAGASSCTVTVNVTNAAGQINSSCGSNPVPFTNASGNVTVTNAINGVTPGCLTVSPCTYSLSPLDLSNLTKAGGTFSVMVTTPAGCAVAVNSFQPWVTVNSIAPSGAVTTVSLQIAPNAGAARATSIVVADRLYLITQHPGP